jgi:hypothetical protein
MHILQIVVVLALLEIFLGSAVGHFLALGDRS